MWYEARWQNRPLECSSPKLEKKIYMKNKRDDVLCFIGQGWVSKCSLYSPCWRRNFHAHRIYYFCWATLHLFLRFICITPLLAQVAGLFSMRGRWSFPRGVPVPDDEIWRPFGFRFPFTTIPCVLEDGRGVRLCYRWLSPCSFFVGLLSTWFCLQAIILISASTNVSNLFFVYAITFIMST